MNWLKIVQKVSKNWERRKEEEVKPSDDVWSKLKVSCELCRKSASFLDSSIIFSSLLFTFISLLFLRPRNRFFFRSELPKRDSTISINQVESWPVTDQPQRTRFINHSTNCVYFYSCFKFQSERNRMKNDEQNSWFSIPFFTWLLIKSSNKKVDSTNQTNHEQLWKVRFDIHPTQWFLISSMFLL